MASRQSRAGRGPARKTAKSLQLAHILTGLSHREFGFAKEELDVLIKYILSSEMDSAGSNYPGAAPRWCLATARPFVIE